MINNEEDKFEISFRVLGNEIFAMNLLSKSTKKNWVIFGLIMLILASIFIQQLTPTVVNIYEIINGD